MRLSISLLKYIALIISCSIIGAVTSAMMALLVRVYKTDMLWDLNAFRLVGEIIGGIMWGCSVMKLEDLGSFMTDQQVISRAKLLSSKE